jgi:macrodomain Ter protein organizer (MatP/YcbG family)
VIRSIKHSLVLSKEEQMCDSKAYEPLKQTDKMFIAYQTPKTQQWIQRNISKATPVRLHCSNRTFETRTFLPENNHVKLHLINLENRIHKQDFLNMLAKLFLLFDMILSCT